MCRWVQRYAKSYKNAFKALVLGSNPSELTKKIKDLLGAFEGFPKAFVIRK
jgi:hypothetical protein